MTIEAVRNLQARLHQSTAALSALGLALNERVKGAPLDPAVSAEVSRVLAALGCPDLQAIDAAQLRQVLAQIRMVLFRSAKLLVEEASPGWQHTEREILQCRLPDDDQAEPRASRRPR